MSEKTPEHICFGFIEKQGLTIKHSRTSDAWVAAPTYKTQGFHHLFRDHEDHYHNFLSVGAIPDDFPNSRQLVKNGDPGSLVDYIHALMPYVAFEGWKQDEDPGSPWDKGDLFEF